jgi:hypothetical protein
MRSTLNCPPPAACCRLLTITITAKKLSRLSCAASMNERVADTLSAFDPRLGAIFNSSTDGINSVLRNIGSAQQDAVERYFRATNSRLVRFVWEGGVDLLQGAVLFAACLVLECHCSVLCPVSSHTRTLLSVSIAAAPVALLMATLVPAALAF